MTDKTIRTVAAGLCLAAVVFFGACGGKNGNSGVRAVLADYIGHTLILPGDSVCSLFDRSYGIAALDADYLVVSYIKSEGCTPCHLHLPYWKAFGSLLDTLSSAIAVPVLVIEPDTLEKVAGFLRTANYDYPVVIDTLGTFSALNRLPEQDFLRTFLIDRNGNILALGNPVEHDKVARHFMTLITGYDKDETPSPLSVGKNKIDIGTVSQSFVREFEFLVDNSSGDTIRVESVMVPCECVVAEADSILPAGSGAVRVTFDASATDGAFHHPVAVRYRNVDSPIIFHIYGYVHR